MELNAIGEEQCVYGVRVKNVKSSMARSPQWRIYYHCSWGQLASNCCNATEVT